MSLDRDDNNVFISRITSALITLEDKGLTLSPTNISKESRYSMYEISLNMHEIESVMDALGL